MAKPLGGVAGLLPHVAEFPCPPADPAANPPAVFAHAPVHLSTFPASLGCLTSLLGEICISWISHCTSHGAALSAAVIVPSVGPARIYCGAMQLGGRTPALSANHKVHPSTSA